MKAERRDPLPNETAMTAVQIAREAVARAQRYLAKPIGGEAPAVIAALSNSGNVLANRLDALRDLIPRVWDQYIPDEVLVVLDGSADEVDAIGLPMATTRFLSEVHIHTDCQANGTYLTADAEKIQALVRAIRRVQPRNEPTTE